MTLADDPIEIPIVEICEGWTVEDIVTEDDCDDAHAYLTGALAGIENQLDDLEMRGLKGDPQYNRVKAASRWKKAALNIVQTKRGKINRKRRAQSADKINTKIIGYMRAVYPAEFQDALEHAISGVDDPSKEAAE